MTAPRPKRYLLTAGELLKHARPVEQKTLALIPPTTALVEITEREDRLDARLVNRPRSWEKGERSLSDPAPPEAAQRRVEDKAVRASAQRFLHGRVKELATQREANRRAQQIHDDVAREARRKAAPKRPPPPPTEAEQAAELVASTRALVAQYAPRRS